MSPRPRRKPTLGVSPPVVLGKSAIDLIGPERAREAAAIIAERFARSSKPEPESDLVKRIRANPELTATLIGGLLFRLAGLTHEEDAADLREFILGELNKMPSPRKRGRPRKGAASWLTELESLAERQQFERFDEMVRLRTARYRSQHKKTPAKLAIEETRRDLGIRWTTREYEDRKKRFK